MEPKEERESGGGDPFRRWAVVTVVAIVIATFVDFCCAWVPALWITPLLYVLYTMCVAAGLLFFLFQKREVRRVLLLVAFIVAMLILYKIQWTTRKPFLLDLSHVRIGMTAQEVDRVMGGYIKGSGIAPVGSFGSDENGQLKLSDSTLYRHSYDGAFNADWGLVRFKDGRVTNVEFLPD